MTPQVPTARLPDVREFRTGGRPCGLGSDGRGPHLASATCLLRSGQVISPPSLSFPICEMGVMTALTWWSHCEGESTVHRKHLALCPAREAISEGGSLGHGETCGPQLGRQRCPVRPTGLGWGTQATQAPATDIAVLSAPRRSLATSSVQ